MRVLHSRRWPARFGGGDRSHQCTGRSPLAPHRSGYSPQSFWQPPNHPRNPLHRNFRRLPLGVVAGATVYLATRAKRKFMNPQPPDPKTLFPSLPVGASADPARPLRICIASFDLVGPVRNGGVGTAFTSLGEALAEAGHEVTFLYLSGQFCENGKLEDWISHYQKKAIRFVPMPSQTEPRIEAPFHMARAYEAYLWLRGQEFDIIHFSELRSPGYYTLLARHQGLAFENTRMCVHTHGPTLWSRLSNSEYVTQIEDLELDDMERFSVKMADVTVSPSQYLFHWMEQQGWQLPQNRFVQQYVQPASACPAQTASADARRQVRELVFFGRLEVRKGLLLFCDALDRLKDDPQARGLKITFLGKVTKVNGRQP